MTNLLQPFVLLRLASAVTLAALFIRAASTALRLLRSADLAEKSAATEGQLLIERRVELAQILARVAAVGAVLDLGLGVLTADRLSHSLRGAMCAYGVFGANRYGVPALALSVALAVLGGVLAQLYAFDALMPRLTLARALARATAVLAPLALIHAALSTLFLLELDLSATASCCSAELDTALAAGPGHVSLPRLGVTVTGGAFVLLAVFVGARVARRPNTGAMLAAGAVAVFASALGVLAVVFGVAPHAFETPHHLCPFCLLHGDVGAIGFPLFGALYAGVVWALGAVTAWLLSREPALSLLFARTRFGRSAGAFLVAFVVGLMPIVRYAWHTGGVFLFP